MYIKNVPIKSQSSCDIKNLRMPLQLELLPMTCRWPPGAGGWPVRPYGRVAQRPDEPARGPGTRRTSVRPGLLWPRAKVGTEVEDTQPIEVRTEADCWFILRWEIYEYTVYTTLPMEIRYTENVVLLLFPEHSQLACKTTFSQGFEA